MEFSPSYRNRKKNSGNRQGQIFHLALVVRRSLLPADRIVVFLAQTAIDETLVNRTRALLTREAVNYAARDTGSSAAGSAQRGCRPGAPQYRAAGCSSRGAYGRSRAATHRRLLQRFSAGTRGNIFLGSLHAFIDVPIGGAVADPLQVLIRIKYRALRCAGNQSHGQEHRGKKIFY